MSPSHRKCRTATLLLCLALAVWLSGNAIAQNPAIYEGIQKNEFMKQWLVLGPIPIGSEPTSPQDEDLQKKAFAKDWLAPFGGETRVAPDLSAAFTISAKTYHWQAVKSSGDAVSLESLFSNPKYVVAYAACDIEMPEAASVLLGVGSDDGMAIWLNGEKVHDRWILRGLEKESDLVPIKLKKGRNRLLLKIQNAEGAWGFMCRVPGDQVLGERVVDCALKGDLTSLQHMAAACDIEMPEAASVLLGVGSDDGMAIWLNGEKVHDRCREST